jgi:DNA-binding transcriptional LysR family regulator
MRVQVTHLDFLEQTGWLSAGKLDVGIFHEAGEHTDIEAEPFFAGEPLAAFLPSGHGLAERPVLRPEDLQTETLIVFPEAANPALNERLLARIEEAGYRFKGIREATGMNPRDIMFSVAEGFGVALGPVSLQEVSDMGSIVLRRPLEPPLSMPDVVVAWRVKPPERLKEKLALVREVASDLRAADVRNATTS